MESGLSGILVLCFFFFFFFFLLGFLHKKNIVTVLLVKRTGYSAAPFDTNDAVTMSILPHCENIWKLKFRVDWAESGQNLKPGNLWTRAVLIMQIKNRFIRKTVIITKLIIISDEIYEIGH